MTLGMFACFGLVCLLPCKFCSSHYMGLLTPASFILVTCLHFSLLIETFPLCLAIFHCPLLSTRGNWMLQVQARSPLVGSQWVAVLAFTLADFKMYNSRGIFKGHWASSDRSNLFSTLAGVGKLLLVFCDKARQGTCVTQMSMWTCSLGKLCPWLFHVPESGYFSIAS